MENKNNLSQGTPKPSLRLEVIGEKGRFVDISEFLGKVVVLRAIAPECHLWNHPPEDWQPGDWERTLDDRLGPEGKKDPQRVQTLIDEFGTNPDFMIIAVRTDFGHGTTKPYQTRYEEAQHYSLQPGFPHQDGKKILYLADNDNRDFLKLGFPTGEVGGGGWATSYVLNRENRIAFQDGHTAKFPYEKIRQVVTELL